MTLTLTIKKKYFQAILDGTKTEEYRDKKKYYDTRFKNKEYTKVLFINGYTNHCPRLLVELKSIVKTSTMYILHLGGIIETKNL